MLAILGVIAVSNCSRIPENNDPVLGIWVKTEINNDAQVSKETSISEEWIFNDVYLGRYHRYDNNEIVFYTDYSWEVVNEVYTISYSKGDMESVQVFLIDSEESQTLQLENGTILAERK